MGEEIIAKAFVKNEPLMQVSTKYKGLRIVFCLPGRSYDGNFLMSWTNMFGSSLHAGMSVKLSQMPYGSGVIARIWCLQGDRLKGRDQPLFGGEPYDYIMWIDSDVIGPFSKFTQLIDKDEPIVSGYYPLGNGVAYSVGRMTNSTGLIRAYGEDALKEETRDEKGLIEADWCGFGWTLIKKGVFEKVGYPWFATPEVEIAGINDVIGEDIYFCRKAQETGYKILVDPDCRVGHEKTIIL